MPKTIIREYDNSTTGISLAVNFSVLVPGFCGRPKAVINNEQSAEEVLAKAIKEGIYYPDTAIYRLSSQKQFMEYVGKFSNSEGQVEVAPVLEVLNSSDPNDTSYNIDKYRKQLISTEWETSGDYRYYEGVQITDVSDPLYGHDGFKLKTFIDEANDNAVITWKFIGPKTALQLAEDILRDDNDGMVSGRTEKSYFKIKIGNEGHDASAKVDHIGNQIAYELLGLGYTVYFKVMQAESDLEDDEFWEPLKNRSTYRIRYLTTGGNYSATVAKKITAIAEFNNNVTVENFETFDENVSSGRGDCIALLDVDEASGAIQSAVSQRAIMQAFGEAASVLPTSKYAAIFAPRVYYNLGYPEDDIYSNDVPFPCSFHYLACAAYAQQRFAEWYAVAGYTRGISPLSISHTSKVFGDVAINTLAPRVVNTYTDKAINLLLNERGNYYLWGNRTAEKLTDKGLIFSHFLNIRQLCCTIKQVLFDATRQFTFDPNSDRLWVNFVNAIRPTLDKMQGDQGISAYKISKVATDKKALLVAKIRIIPIEAIEDFDISIYLEDSLSGIDVGFDETVAE